MIAAEGCIDEAQGYLFSIPIPGRQIRELLMSSTPQWLSRKARRSHRRPQGPPGRRALITFGRHPLLPSF